MSVARSRNRQIGSWSSGVLLVRVNVKKLAIAYSTGHIWFGNRGIGRGGGGGGGGGGGAKGEIFSPSPPLSLFWSSLTPLVKISFSPQLTTAIKIKDGGHNYRWKNTEYSLAKITPALQARRISKQDA